MITDWSQTTLTAFWWDDFWETAMNSQEVWANSTQDIQSSAKWDRGGLTMKKKTKSPPEGHTALQAASRELKHVKIKAVESILWQPNHEAFFLWGKLSSARNNWPWPVLLLAINRAELWNYPDVSLLNCMSAKRQNVNTSFSLQMFTKTVTKGEVQREREKETQRGGISWNIHVTFSLMLHLNYRRASHANPIGRLCQEIHNHSAILITPVGFVLYLICTRHSGHYQPCVSASALRVSGNQI